MPSNLFENRTKSGAPKLAWAVGTSSQTPHFGSTRLCRWVHLAGNCEHCKRGENM